jgi:hypothetical protein
MASSLSSATATTAASAAASLHVKGASLRFKNLLIVIKQTAFEEYSQVRRD